MQPMRTHVTHGLAMDCLCVGKVGNKSTNIRATHQCLLNRMQALHKGSETFSQSNCSRMFCAYVVVFAQCQAILQEKKLTRLYFVKTTISLDY